MPTPKICLARSIVFVLFPVAVAMLLIDHYFTPLHALVFYGVIVFSFVVGYQYIGNIVYTRPKKNESSSIIKIKDENDGKRGIRY